MEFTYSMTEIAEMAECTPNMVREMARRFLRRNGVVIGNLGGRISVRGASILVEEIRRQNQINSEVL